jgi:2-oxoglutarate ferredoxin oxidoreductase subunit delta
MGTFQTVNPGDQPVWINTNNCKACDRCVAECPAGVLAMVYEETSVLGKMISIEHPESCIGCMECELICPDFAIFVADKKEFKAAGHSFDKLTDEAKKRQIEIVENNYMTLQGAK